MSKTPKSDQLRAMREARHAGANRSLKGDRPDRVFIDDPDGRVEVAKKLAALINDPANWKTVKVDDDEISSPSLIPVKKRGRPRKTEDGFDKAAWQREYMRKKRAKEGK